MSAFQRVSEIGGKAEMAGNLVCAGGSQKDPVLAAYPVLGFVLDFAVYKVFICSPLLLQPDCRRMTSIGFPDLDCDIGKIWRAKQSVGIV